MTAPEKTRLRILIALVVVAGLAWYFVYRPSSVSSTDVPGTRAANPAKDLKVAQEAQIRLDLLEGIAAEDAGRKNLFQYREKPLPPQPPQPRPQITSTPPMVSTPIPSREPPPPAFKAFRYEGFSLVPKTGKMLASLSESGNSYEVVEGECLMGQYCVRRITENLVEIEDVFLNRRQTFTRTQ